MIAHAPNNSKPTKMTNKTSSIALAVSLVLAAGASAQIQGPSTGSTPHATPVAAGVTTWSIATVDNTGANPDDTFTNLITGVPNSYGMAGIPDGMGSFDNFDGTFTVLMNHEIGNTNGVARAHGSVGAFVSKWIVNKDTLAVVGGADLTQTVKLWNGAGYTSYNSASPMPNLGAPYRGAFGRFCSADLPEISAFANGLLGTTERIFMNGEEIGNDGVLSPTSSRVRKLESATSSRASASSPGKTRTRVLSRRTRPSSSAWMTRRPAKSMCMSAPRRTPAPKWTRPV